MSLSMPPKLIYRRNLIYIAKVTHQTQVCDECGKVSVPSFLCDVLKRLCCKSLFWASRTSPLDKLFSSHDTHHWLWQVDSWPAGWWRDSSTPWLLSPCPCPLPPPTVCGDTTKEGENFIEHHFAHFIERLQHGTIHTPHTHTHIYQHPKLNKKCV